MPSNIDFLGGSGGDIVQPRGRFASPWSDLAQQYAPRSFTDALRLCEFLYANNSVYRKASERVVSYFLTKVKLSGQSDTELDKFRPVMNNKFGIMERLKEMGENHMAYGNAFCSLIPSYIRMVKCTSCKSRVRPMMGLNFDFRVADMTCYLKCDRCHKTCRHMIHDFPDPNPENIRLVHRDPKSITIEHNPECGISNYWMDIDPQTVSRVRGGDRFMIATTPWSVLQAISRGQRYKFDPNYFFHLKEGCIAGIKLQGWGLPSILSAFKDFFRIQVLRLYDETLMMDYIIPMRIISPAGNPVAGNDMMATANMGVFRDQMQGAIMRHRIDGADWNIFPFPINYQAVGGEGRSLSPIEMIKEEEDRLLNARGIPPQLYRGDLLLQTAPTALRVFERSWTPLVDGLNKAAQWMVTGLAQLIKSGDITAQIDSVTLSDDMEARGLRVQLMQAQMISKETGLGPMDIDVKAERKRMLEEQKADQREQTRTQQEMEMEAMSLDTPEGDAQGTGGGAAGATPMDTQGQGAEIARQLMDPSVPETARRQQLTALRQSNDTLHAVVIKEMDKLRNAAGTMGQAQGMPQAIAQSQEIAQSQTVPTPGAAQSQPKTAGMNIITPNLKNRDTLVDSTVDFNKVAGFFPTAINVTRADEFRMIKWGGAELGIDLDGMGDVFRSGTIRDKVATVLGMTVNFDADETSFE